MKTLILILASALSLSANAINKTDAVTSVHILKTYPGVSIVCIEKNTAYGFMWDDESRRVVTAVSSPADAFGTNKTLLLDTFPGAVRLAIPKSKEDIDSDLIVAVDENENPIVLTKGSIGKADNILCAYRADDVLYTYILQFLSDSDGIVLE